MKNLILFTDTLRATEGTLQFKGCITYPDFCAFEDNLENCACRQAEQRENVSIAELKSRAIQFEDDYQLMKAMTEAQKFTDQSELFTRMFFKERFKKTILHH